MIAAAGLLMGSGVVAMHYVGMAAMRMAATLTYERLWLLLSVLIALGASSAAVWLAARDRALFWRFGRLMSCSLMTIKTFEVSLRARCRHRAIACGRRTMALTLSR